jgi:hypothetical protein
VWSLVALAVMTAVSIAVGWLVAGRVLAPLRTMTATTRRIPQDNLHQRLTLPGPRDELRELGDTIDGLLARLEAAFASQRRFVANAAHELRIPLARIRTALEAAVGKPGSVSPQVVALDRKVREGLDRANQLVDGFLELGRAEHGELPDRAAVALDQVIAAVIAEREPDRARLTVESGGPTLDPCQVRELAQPFRRLGAERTGSALDQRHWGSAVRVLVVEDERGLADDITEGLRDHGLAVDVTYDGLDAASKINLYPYLARSHDSSASSATPNPSRPRPASATASPPTAGSRRCSPQVAQRASRGRP